MYVNISQNCPGCGPGIAFRGCPGFLAGREQLLAGLWSEKYSLAPKIWSAPRYVLCYNIQHPPWLQQSGVYCVIVPVTVRVELYLQTWLLCFIVHLLTCCDTHFAIQLVMVWWGDASCQDGDQTAETGATLVTEHEIDKHHGFLFLPNWEGRAAMSWESGRQWSPDRKKLLRNIWGSSGRSALKQSPEEARRFGWLRKEALPTPFSLVDATSG